MLRSMISALPLPTYMIVVANFNLGKKEGRRKKRNGKNWREETFVFFHHAVEAAVIQHNKIYFEA